MSLAGHLNAFGYLLLKHCERQGKTLREIAHLSGLKGTSRIYYAIRPKAPNRRTTPLSEEELVRLAKALHLSVEGEEELVITAQLEASPPRLRKYVRKLEATKPTLPARK